MNITNRSSHCLVGFPHRLVIILQNELEEEDAKVLAKNKVWAVVEGANMPCNAEAIKHLEEYVHVVNDTH